MIENKPNKILTLISETKQKINGGFNSVEDTLAASTIALSEWILAPIKSVEKELRGRNRLKATALIGVYSAPIALMSYAGYEGVGPVGISLLGTTSYIYLGALSHTNQETNDWIDKFNP